MCIYVCVGHTLWWLKPSLCSLSTRLFPEALSKHHIEGICDTPLPLDSQSKALQTTGEQNIYWNDG